MEKEHFQILEEDYLFLNRCMMKNTKLFIQFLTEEQEIMDEATAEDILDEVSLFRRAQRMLDFIMNKNDEEAFDSLYKGCLHVHLWKAADILMPENAPHEPEEEEDIEEHLPEQWPSESHFNMIKDPTKLEVKPSGPKMKGLYQKCTQGDSELYNMTRKDKGRLVIIDNEEFDHMPNRVGSTYDGKGLSYLFSNLGFEVHQESNLTCKEMMDVMEGEVKHVTAVARCSCFILAIMSYGWDDNNGVFGTDGVYNEKKEDCKNYIEMTKIKKLFTLTALTNKPKVFLIVAQQQEGSRYRERRRPPKKYNKYSMHNNDNFGAMAAFREPLINIPRKITMPTHHFNLPKMTVDGPKGTNLQKLDIMKESLSQKMSLKHYDIGENLMPSHRRHGNTSRTEADGLTLDDSPTLLDGPGDETEKIPKDADIFQAVVTPREMLVYRGETIGTWFIQAFIYVMINYAHQKDLGQLFGKINELGANQAAHSEEVEEIDHFLPKFTANKKLYFFPGIGTEE